MRFALDLNIIVKTHVLHFICEVKSAYEPKWPIRAELIPVYVVLSDWEYCYSPPGWDASPSQGYPQH